LTLIFGLLANLYTAVFVSRVIFDAVLSRKGRGEALSI
jgi:preprotein translocase subunit SecD